MSKINKTTRYLFIPVVFQEKPFISNYNLCHKGLSIYLDDTGTDDDYCDGCLYFYFNTTKIPKFEERLLFFRMTECYVKDYVISETEHMIIFKYPDEFQSAFMAFISGWYHLMYDSKIIETYFSKHMNYLIKYKDIQITLDNYEILENIDSLEKEFKNIQISPYHVLKKSKDLETLLSKLYNVDKKFLTDLESKPKFSEEVFRWNPKKYEYADSKYVI